MPKINFAIHLRDKVVKNRDKTVELKSVFDGQPNENLNAKCKTYFTISRIRGTASSPFFTNILCNVYFKRRKANCELSFSFCRAKTDV